MIECLKFSGKLSFYCNERLGNFRRRIEFSLLLIYQTKTEFKTIHMTKYRDLSPNEIYRQIKTKRGRMKLIIDRC